MKAFIQRDYRRTEHDDYILNVEPKVTMNFCSVYIFHPETKEVIGWKIQRMYE